MPIINRIAAFHDEMTAWRRELHAHPETAFQEHRTADYVAAKLTEFGIPIDRGLAGTGVVGTIKRGDGPAIGLRADMDALHIHEANGFGHKSQNAGKMHACGHDGHTTMLLGAARYLAEAGRFAGTVHLIFQPAEETEGGGRKMIEDGLFRKFPVQEVYGMHNWPGTAVGRFAVRAGPMLAATDTFEIVVTGKGGHAAMPHTVIDPVLAAANIITALQQIASRNTHPVDSAVVSVTQIHAGDAWNVIPEQVLLRGTARAFKPAVRDMVERRMKEVVDGIAAAHGATATYMYKRNYPPTVNHERETEIAARAAATVVGEANVDRNPMPTMGGEDFAFMLEQKPGCYIFIGNGPSDGGRVLHSPHYDFNDEVLPIGASYWATLVEQVLPAG
ncbi:MAG TPA: M20 aminoacylase family protein [Alphaproteobacteria bacterium]|nr:M20 aminoacylase family protein [Alphaproteobacteria bacterium]